MGLLRGRLARVSAALAVACGGSGATLPSSVDAGNEATTSDGSSSPDGPNVADTQGPSDGAVPPCPDVTGAYTIAPLNPPMPGCGMDFDPAATQCIATSSQTCQVVFSSASSDGGAGTVVNSPKGTSVSIDGKGNFASADLDEGSGSRSGCTGTWDATTATMTVDCGGMGSTQSCVLTLHRTGSACN